jgi:tRNA wybutosine-synthesizing protein 4
VIQEGLDLNLPTLFISECCLIYLDAFLGDRIIDSCYNLIQKGMFITFEQIEPSDAFGSTMITNLKVYTSITLLKTRGITLTAIDAYPTLESQKIRYSNAGWETTVIDYNEIWRRLPREEQDRISKLEIFDEIEEWVMLSAHYCLVTAYKN